MREQGIVGASVPELPSDLFKNGIVGLCEFFLEREPGVKESDEGFRSFKGFERRVFEAQ